MSTWATSDDSAAAYGRSLGEFIAASPSSFHVAATVAHRLEGLGWRRLGEEDEWPAAPGRYVATRDGAVIAWVVPAPATALTPFRIIGAHSDSPGFRIKPQPTASRHGWFQVAVEIYGGPVLHSWFDRELRIAGVVCDAEGASHLVDTEPIARIPNLAVHLDRSLATGITVDRQAHTQPVLQVASDGDCDLISALARSAGIPVEELSGWDLALVDSQEPRLFGSSGKLLASGRLDNLSSAYAGLSAFECEAESMIDGDAVSVLAIFDHEEVGSATRSGAAGPFLEDVLRRVSLGLGADDSEYRRALANSVCLSADAGHGVHPNYPEKHDPQARPMLGAGPMIKVNANQRYASDGPGAALWRRWCAARDVANQAFVSHNEVPCGSTIGPMTAARIGVRTIDVGVPLLSMHSARELAHVDDLLGLREAMRGFIGDERSVRP